MVKNKRDFHGTDHEATTETFSSYGSSRQHSTWSLRWSKPFLPGNLLCQVEMEELNTNGGEASVTYDIAVLCAQQCHHS